MNNEEYKNRDDTALIYYAINKMNLRHMTDELVDVGYIGLTQGYRTYNRSKGALSTYLTVCIKNEIKKFIRSQNFKKRKGETVSLDTLFAGDKNLMDMLPDKKALNVDKIIIYDILYKCISNLEPDYGDIIFKHHILGMSTLDIAKIYNQSRENIAKKLDYARRELKKSLIKNGITNGYVEE